MRLSACITAGILAASSASIPAAAYPIGDLSLYEKVYLENTVVNKPVLIIDIDYAGNRVKVEEDDGFAKWVSADRILSKWENSVDVMTKIGGISLIAYCVYKVPDCDSNRLGTMLHYDEYVPGAPLPKVGGGFVAFFPPPTAAGNSARGNGMDDVGPNGVPNYMDPEYFKTPGETGADSSNRTAGSRTRQSYDPDEAARSAAAGRNSSSGTTVEDAFDSASIRIYVENDCREPILVHYAIQTPGFARAGDDPLTILPGERQAATLGSYSEFDGASKFYFTARSEHFEWKENQTIIVGNSSRPYILGDLYRLAGNSRAVSISCPGE